MSPGLKFKGKNGVSTGVYLVISKEGGVEEGGGGERCYTVSHPGYLPNCHFDIHSVFYRK